VWREDRYRIRNIKYENVGSVMIVGVDIIVCFMAGHDMWDAWDLAFQPKIPGQQPDMPGASPAQQATK
jgi:hypothetical protein